MKIAILTLPFHTNYGGILQGWALMEVLEEMGHEVFFVKQQSPIKIFRAFYRLILRKCTYNDFLISINKHKLHNQYQRSFSEFINSSFTFITTKEALKMNALVIGSDQIWRKHYYSSLYDAFGAFAQRCKNIKRITYAVSFGLDEWEYTDKETRKISSLIDHFDALSFREKSGIRMVEEMFSRSSNFVIDPTLLLNRDKYNILSKEVISKSNSSLFAFVLDGNEDKKKVLNRINSKLNLEIIEISKWGEDSIHECSVPAGIKNWLACFRDADFVFTDSYHGCLFSIIFNKPFIVYGNKSRGLSRFSTIINEFNLQERYITCSSELRIDILKIGRASCRERV